MTVSAKPNCDHVSRLQRVDSQKPNRIIEAQAFPSIKFGGPDNDSDLPPKPVQRPRRYQLHLWISEREYTLLKSLAESQDEPMSRIVRRLFGQLRPLVDREGTRWVKS